MTALPPTSVPVSAYSFALTNSPPSLSSPSAVSINFSLFYHRPLDNPVTLGAYKRNSNDNNNIINNEFNINHENNMSMGTSTPLDIPTDGRSSMENVLIAVVLGAIVILTISGNVLVIASVILNGNLRTTTNYFIANLAVADLLLGTTVLPFSATLEVLQRWVFGQIFCDVWAAIDVLCCTASILSLCVISIDRYIGVTRPLQHARIMRHARAAYIIIFVWVLSLTISVAPLIGWKEAPNPDPSVCTVTTHPGYVLFSVAGSFYIPCLTILAVYFRIYQETVKYTRCLKAGAKTAKVDEENIVSLRIHTGRSCESTAAKGGGGGGGGGTSLFNQSKSSLRNSPGSRESSGRGGSNSSRRCSRLFTQDERIDKKRSSRMTFSSKVAKFKREKKAAKTLGIVVGVFITCWLPFFIVLPLGSLCSSCSIPDLMFKLFFWLGYCNSTMNPIIYTCFSAEFRRAFLGILCCRRCRQRPKVSLTEIQLRGNPGALGRHSGSGRRSYSAIKSQFKSPFCNGKANGPSVDGQEETSTHCHSSSANNSYGNGDSSSFGSDCKYSPNSYADFSHPPISQCFSTVDKDYSNDGFVRKQRYQNSHSHLCDHKNGKSANKSSTAPLNGYPGRATKSSFYDITSGDDLSRVSSSLDISVAKMTSSQEHEDNLCSILMVGGGMEIISASNRTELDIDILKGDGSDRLSAYSLTETISCSD